MQSFAMADAKLYDGRCKALRWPMQSFTMADAKLCVRQCKALRKIVASEGLSSPICGLLWETQIRLHSLCHPSLFPQVEKKV